jgi:DNA (cytosine-5)-methyltransferase 1
VLLENVPFMLQLDNSNATHNLTIGNYRGPIVDSRAFGLPQRRQRVFSSRPANGSRKNHRGKACGFYWTEGVRGLGWAVDAVPTLKGGSTIGIPATPDIRDAERMQGFPTDWTLPAATSGNRNAKLETQ